jgi:hypothetical protein
LVGRSGTTPVVPAIDGFVGYELFEATRLGMIDGHSPS